MRSLARFLLRLGCLSLCSLSLMAVLAAPLHAQASLDVRIENITGALTVDPVAKTATIPLDREVTICLWVVNRGDAEATGALVNGGADPDFLEIRAADIDPAVAVCEVNQAQGFFNCPQMTLSAGDSAKVSVTAAGIMATGAALAKGGGVGFSTTTGGPNAGSDFDTFTFEIVEAPPPILSIIPSNVTVDANGTQAFSAFDCPRDANGNPDVGPDGVPGTSDDLCTPKDEVAWSVSGNIGTVDPMTGPTTTLSATLPPGSTQETGQVIAASDDGRTASADVTVERVPVAYVSEAASGPGTLDDPSDPYPEIMAGIQSALAVANAVKLIVTPGNYSGIEVTKGKIVVEQEGEGTVGINGNVTVEDGEIYFINGDYDVSGDFMLGTFGTSGTGLPSQSKFEFHPLGRLNVQGSVRVAPDLAPNSNDPSGRNRFFLSGGELGVFGDYTFAGTGDRFDDDAWLLQEQGLVGDVIFVGSSEQNVWHRQDEDAFFNNVVVAGEGSVKPHLLLQSNVTQNAFGYLRLELGTIHTDEEAWEWIILNPGFEENLAGRNNAAVSNGVVQLGSRDSYINGTVQRIVESGNATGGMISGGYLFPVGAKGESRDNGGGEREVDFFRPLILQFPDDLGRSSVARVDYRQDLTNADVDFPDDGLDVDDIGGGSLVLDVVGNQFWQLEFDRIPSFDPNVRVEPGGLPNVFDIEKLRLIQWDCDGSDPHPAGTYPEADQGAVINDFVNGVPNITQEEVEVKDCNLFGLGANGSINPIDRPKERIEVSDLDEGALRDALNTANANPSSDVINVIEFPMEVILRAHRKQETVIRLQQPLPTIARPTVIDGAGVVILDGGEAGDGAHGLHFTDDNSGIIGLTVTSFSGHGLLLEGEGLHRISRSRLIGNGGDGLHAAPDARALVTQTTIFGNGGLGIDLAGDGPTPNDDTESDGVQNFPLITSVGQGSLILTGEVISTPDASFTLEFFANTACDASGHGEGEVFLGRTDLVTDATGAVSFEIRFDTTFAERHFITATATNASGNTSEFSPCDASVTTSIEQASHDGVPAAFRLHANYPNPFNPATTLVFDLPEVARVRVEVIDVLGRMVWTLPPQPVEAGAGRMLDLDASVLPSGTYLYRLTAEGAARTMTATGRMVLVK